MHKHSKNIHFYTTLYGTQFIGKKGNNFQSSSLLALIFTIIILQSFKFVHRSDPVYSTTINFAINNNNF